MITLKSLLTETLSDKFIKWFSGSDVVDSSGNPKILYHGTNKPIDKFSPHRMGKSSNVFGTWEIKRYGIFLAEDEKLAHEFGPHIVSVYARCYDPLDLTKGIRDATFNTMQDYVDSKGADGFSFARFISKHAESSKTWKLFDEDEGNDPGYMIDIFKGMGYDGVIINEPSESDNISNKVWVLFDPNQVWIVNGSV